MARGHTQIEYARLLKEYLQKNGFRVGIELEVRGKHGESISWDGFLRIARMNIQAEGYSDFAFPMCADASVHVDDEGEIRLHYHEPIIVNLEKKAKRMAQEALEREKAADIEESFVAGDFEEDGWCETPSVEECDVLDFDEELEEVKEEVTMQDFEEEQVSAENYEYMSDEEELQLLRALNGEYTRISLGSPKNETWLCFNNHYFMDACSRNSAKKAASRILDDLYGVCASMKRLSEQLGFKRVNAEKEWIGWEKDCILDEFEQIDEVCEQKRAEARRKAEEEERAELEKKTHWDEQWGNLEEILRKGEKEIQEKGKIENFSDMIMYHIASDCMIARLELQIRQQEEKNLQMQRSIEQKKEEFARLQTRTNCSK